MTRDLADSVQARMADLFDVTLNRADKALSRDDLINAMQSCDVLVPTVTDMIDAEMISKAGPRLKLIANFGSGVDNIDLKAARERNIIVTNTPGVFTEDTADMTMALILSVPRRLAEGEKLVRSGKWEGWKPSGMLGHRIHGKTLGIIGMGRIGQAVAKRAAGFGLTVRYHNRKQFSAAAEQQLGASYEPDLDTLIAGSDIISLHCPHTAETHELINSERIGKMKESAYIVNTSRGEIIDENALILSVPRRLAEGEKLVRSGKWEGWKPSGMLGHRIHGKTLGIIGMGRIGQAVAKRAAGFGLTVRYHNRKQFSVAAEQQLGASYEPDLDTLIAESDIISLHCPHTAETHELFNSERIGKMKKSAYIVNTSRGEIIDENALILALQAGKISGAGLDVYTDEPKVDERLLALKNVVLLPHVGSATFEGREEAGGRVIANIRIWADGHRPPDQVLEGWA